MKEGSFGWINGVEKIKVLDGGTYEMVVSSCFEDLEGGVGLKSVGVCSRGEKKRGIKG